MFDVNDFTPILSPISGDDIAMLTLEDVEQA